MAVSEAVENYLETIYILSRKCPEVHAVDVCNYLSYSRPTISVVLRQMREAGLVIVNDENHIYLTEEGEKIAKHIYERHELFTKLFVILGVPEDIAQRDACKVEHDVCDETFEAVKQHLRAEHPDMFEF